MFYNTSSRLIFGLFLSVFQVWSRSSISTAGWLQSLRRGCFEHCSDQ